MAMNKVSICLLLLLPLAYAKFGFGPCPKPEKVHNFDVARYMGYWYEHVRTVGIPHQDGECSKAHYVLNQGKVAVTNFQLQADGKIDVANGELYCDGTDAQCHVRFSPNTPYGDYQVIDTDYDNYTVIYSCADFAGITHIEYGWVLTRNPEFNADEKVNFLVSSSGLNHDDLHRTSQDNCPAFSVHGF